ncbi:hypothetical protein [Microcella alkalica]|uniref:hypothetical protein n=1 Tax=Microcella alkalica TaxID=355930 RepID=UPI00166085C4|nr:hypothetical protein [Microcella alkalica]
MTIPNDRDRNQGFTDRDRDGRDDRTEVLHHDQHDRHDRDHDGIDDRREAVAAPVGATGARHGDHAVDEDPRALHREVIAREKEEYGGIKWGSAFFGWLTAVGTALLLTALVAGTGTALGLANDTTAEEAVEGAARQPDTVGIVGAIILALVVFIAYYAGGYVAGRMARLDGAKQGIAVWLWAIIIAIVVAIIGAIGGAQFNVLANLNGFPRLPIGEGELTTVGIITAVVVALVSLGGAVLGGLAGMRFHRKVDRAGLGLERH